MPEAWVVRESQRQELLEDLMATTYEKEAEEEGSSYFFLLLSAAITRHLLSKKHPGSSLSVITAGWLFTESVSRFLTQEVLPKIQKFSRTQIEADALLAKLLEKILQSCLVPFGSALLHEEISNPKQIFNAPSAMTEM